MTATTCQRWRDRRESYRPAREGPFRRLRHPGNYVYAWALRSGVELAELAGTYPKQAIAA